MEVLDGAPHLSPDKDLTERRARHSASLSRGFMELRKRSQALLEHATICRQRWGSVIEAVRELARVNKWPLAEMVARKPG